MRPSPDEVRAFARRRWDLREDEKQALAAEQYRRDPVGHVRSIEALRQHVRAVRPEWPTEDDLARDHADHVELKRKLDRAAVVFARR